MRMLITWMVRIVVLLFTIKLAMWAWEQYQGSGPVAEEEVLDMDKDCRIISVDTGQCLCRHRTSNKILNLPREECMSRAQQTR